MRSEQHTIEHALHVSASPESVWREITEVDIASFDHPLYLSMLGIPKPLRAEVVQSGVGGARMAFFSNGLCFRQEITEWRPPHRYAFTFRPDPGFRVAYVLDLCDGPFRMISGAYSVKMLEAGVELSLSSRYGLFGAIGVCLRMPVKRVLDLFQMYLLRGIKANAEQRQ